MSAKFRIGKKKVFNQFLSKVEISTTKNYKGKALPDSLNGVIIVR